jgi:triosephosphate isomerase
MSEKVWIGTGWKMNKTIAEALEYVHELSGATIPDDVQVFILPPHTALAAVRAALPATSPVLIGAQNAHWAREGAQTGEISMRMAADAGALLVEIGHSERRSSFGESDETVCLKVRAALDSGLVPLICVGEATDARDAGEAEAFVVSQVRGALADLHPHEVSGVLVAYEPVWAIGEHGRAATVDETGPVMAAIAREIGAVSGGTGCRALLYGGSVNRGNAEGLLADAHTDGLFVGRAAWTAAGLLELVEVAHRCTSAAGSLASS